MSENASRKIMRKENCEKKNCWERQNWKRVILSQKKKAISSHFKWNSLMKEENKLRW